MSLSLTYSLLGAAAGPFVIAFSNSIATGEPASWRTVTAAGWRPTLAASALQSVVLAEAAARWPAAAGALAWLTIVGVLLALIDWSSHRLPHRVVGALLGGGLVQLGLVVLVQRDAWPLLRAGVAAAVVLLIVLTLGLISPTGLGLGDVTLSTTMAFLLGWFGWLYVAAGLMIAFLSTGLAMSVLRARKLISRDEPIALGPALIFAPICVILLF
jgi:leader peptidase (prepilin peptidase) / N-methyltransferase